jgi:Tfp pilus assembly protein PilF
VLTALRQEDAVLGDGTELPGASDSPARNLLAGYVARRIGHTTRAREYLSRALEQFEAIDRKNEHMKLRKPMPVLTPPHLRRHIEELQ